MRINKIGRITFCVFIIASFRSSVLYAGTDGDGSKETPSESVPEDQEKHATSFYDLLLNSGCAASILLGIEPTVIERPGSPTDFSIALYSAANPITSVPLNFALDFTPYWFTAPPPSYSEYMKGTNVKETIKQTISWSLGASLPPVLQDDSLCVDTSFIASGLRFSLLRGHPSPEFTDSIAHLYQALATGTVIRNFIQDVLLARDKLYNFLESLDTSGTYVIDSDSLSKMIFTRRCEMQTRAEQELFNDTDKRTYWVNCYAESTDTILGVLKNFKLIEEKKLANMPDTAKDSVVLARIAFLDTLIIQRTEERKGITNLIVDSLTEIGAIDQDKLIEKIDELLMGNSFRRLGFKWDFAGGGVLAFPENNSDNIAMHRVGAWTTLGGEWPAVSWLGVLRYWHNFDESVPSTVDLGTRLVFTKPKKFSISAEVLYRVPIHFANAEGDWRCILTTDFNMIDNSLLSVSIGKDFSIDTEDMIVSVSIKQGVGSQRPTPTEPPSNTTTTGSGSEKPTK